MKISKYKIFDDGIVIAAAGSHFAQSKLVVAFDTPSQEVAVRWTDIPVKDIISVVYAADVEADDAYEATVEFATASPSVGDEFALTIQYPDSRQRVRKSFRYVAKAGDDVTAIAVAFKDLINASDIPFGASNASGVLTIIADVEGAGYEPIIDAGTDSASTTIVFTKTVSDAVRDTAAALAAKLEGVDADDFGTLTAAKGYQQYYITYTELVPTAHGKVIEERVAAIFIDGNTVPAATLDADLNAATYIAGKEDLLA